jgi:hypothetical protein
MIIVGTSDVAITGNVFSGVKPKALAVGGQASKRVVFSNNVLTDVESDHTKLDNSSLVNDNLEPE